MSQPLDLNSIDSVLPQLSALPTTATDSSILQNGRPATLSQSMGIKICSMVILAAQDLTSCEEGLPAENVIQLEWVTDSIFVTRSGHATHSSDIVLRVRKLCIDTPPVSFEEVVSMFVDESNKKLGSTCATDATDVKYTFMVGERLHREQDCHLFLVKRDYEQNPSLYVSKSGVLLLAPTSCGKKFFTDDMKLKLQQAEKDYDRALLCGIVKEVLGDPSHETRKGRVCMVTVDERGFHVFECAEYDEAKGGYKASKVNGFYPVGYRIPAPVRP